MRAIAGATASGVQHTLPVLTALLDTHMFDWLLVRPWALDRVRRAQADGALRLLVTHVQRDELNAIKDAERWAALEALRGSLEAVPVPTTGLVLGVSRLGEATLIDRADLGLWADLSKDNPKHAEDALLALTARQHEAVLVTEDKTFRARAATHGIRTASGDDFIASLPA